MMIENKFLENFNFQSEAMYKIIVQGEIGQDWSDVLANMQISVSKRSNKKTYTTLVGKIVDQAALSSVLNTLYDLQVTVVSVNILSEFEDD